MIPNPNYKEPNNNENKAKMKKNLYLLFVLLAFTACGNKSRSNSSEPEDNPADLIEIERRAYKDGHAYGSDDACDGKPYLTSCNTKSAYDLWGTKKQSEAWTKGFRNGYDDGYNEGKAAQRTEYENTEYENSTVTVTTSSTSNTYSHPRLNSYTIHSDESIYGDYYNYKETNNCEEGAVVYEGTGTCYIVETRKGYTVMEDYSGSLFEGAKVRGELNQYNFKYLINRNRNQEIKVYIEDYMLSDKQAIELLGKKNRLKPDDQSAYDANND